MKRLFKHAAAAGILFSMLVNGLAGPVETILKDSQGCPALSFFHPSADQVDSHFRGYLPGFVPPNPI